VRDGAWICVSLILFSEQAMVHWAPVHAALSLYLLGDQGKSQYASFSPGSNMHARNWLALRSTVTPFIVPQMIFKGHSR